MSKYAARFTETLISPLDGSLLRSASFTVTNTGGAPVSLYTDKLRSGSVANPLTTDVNGLADFYADPGDIKLVIIYDSGHTPSTINYNLREDSSDVPGFFFDTLVNQGLYSPSLGDTFYATDIDQWYKGNGTTWRQKVDLSLGVTRFDVEAGYNGTKGLSPSNSAADNDTALAALLAFVPNGCELVAHSRYNISQPSDQSSRHSLRWSGPGSSDGAYAAAAFIMTAAVARIFDWRSSRNMLNDGVSLIAAGGSGFAGVILDSGDSGNNATMNEIRRLTVQGDSYVNVGTCLGLDGAYEFLADHVEFSHFSCGSDGFNLGGRGGGITKFAFCKWESPGLGAPLFKDPNVSCQVDHGVMEGDANGKLKILVATNQPVHGFGLHGPWIGDVGTPNSDSMMDIPENSTDIFITSQGGQIIVPGNLTPALAYRLVKLTGNNVRGLVIDGYLQGGGIGVDYGSTTGHHGCQHRFVTDHNGQEFVGTIPSDTVGIASEFGRRLGASVQGAGTADPNGVNFGNVGDEWTNSSGASGHVKWIKQTGNNTSTGWVAVA